ncbi:hypothetical protein [Streptomyces sp. NPDC048644]|uniref:hypothetical protein n=1 Tax=Streptomyces sp. NPDC048644 TaxID=3365582 RepID=UPI0037175AE7
MKCIRKLRRPDAAPRSGSPGAKAPVGNTTRQKAWAEGHGSVQQVGGSQYNFHFPARTLTFNLPLPMLAVALVLYFAVNPENPAPAPSDPIPPVSVKSVRMEAVPGQCIVYQDTAGENRAVLGDCGDGNPVWRMARFPSGYVRFDIPAHPDRCLGASGNGGTVGTWNCHDNNSAWSVDSQADGSAQLHTQEGDDRGWSANCLIHQGKILRLAPCKDASGGDSFAYRWKVE